ncbi:aldehyde dehydrogenase family protein [Streptomyces sp. NPDC102270]|uniref:aldehyde dehydrogenase family protein n=1 Tax=Streptomyces sp. NPDC102270 TaxID=3366150 RepID=UPI003803BD74
MPLSQARIWDVNAAIGIFEYFASLCDSMAGQVNDGGSLLDITVLEPYGVIAAIVQFNWPPIHTASKPAPALAVDNAVVIKPPEQAPLSSLLMVEIIQSVLPDDVRVRVDAHEWGSSFVEGKRGGRRRRLPDSLVQGTSDCPCRPQCLHVSDRSRG